LDAVFLLLPFTAKLGREHGSLAVTNHRQDIGQEKANDALGVQTIPDLLALRDRLLSITLTSSLRSLLLAALPPPRSADDQFPELPPAAEALCKPSSPSQLPRRAVQTFAVLQMRGEVYRRAARSLRCAESCANRSSAVSKPFKTSLKM